jgi:hypothetical protein
MAAKTNSTTTLVPPDDSMWQKYSSRFELPLASATSIFMHGTIVGGLVIVAMASLWAAREEAAMPPKMDVVMIEGNGSGLEGMSGETGLPGPLDAGGPKRTELTSPAADTTPPERTVPRLFKDPPLELGLPVLHDDVPGSELSIELEKLAKEADNEVKKAMAIPTTPAPLPPAKKASGTGNPKGVGGSGGAGDGVGKGSKPGPGVGSGGTGGRKATAQDVYAMRWHFDLSGDPKEHARKLAVIGFTVAIPDPKGGFYLVTDLKRRPVEMKKESLIAYKDAVKYYNTKRESVQGLARELQLPFMPEYIVLLLPQDRERQMADEEKRFADSNQRNVQLVRHTWFDFRPRNGVYDPTVIRQE